MTVVTTVDAQILEAGKITLPAKKLNEIVSKLSNDLITDTEIEESETEEGEESELGLAAGKREKI